MKGNRVYDFIVLGAGAAGCAAARGIAETYPDARVALIEEGPPFPPPSIARIPALQPFLPQLPQMRSFVRRIAGAPEENLGGRGLSYIRGRGLGGSCLLNDMLYLRPTVADMEAWGDDEWTYNAMLPYFRSLEDNHRGLSSQHGVDGPLTVSDASRSNTEASLNVRFFEACEAAGVPSTNDFNAGDASGFSAAQSHIKGGARVSVYDALIGQRMHAMPNLTILAHTRAECITFDEHNKKATGVVCSGNVKEHVSSGQIIVCLGALGSPLLLQRSGIGSCGRVVDNPSVGQNLIQGCQVDCIFRIDNSTAVRSKSLSPRNATYFRQQWHEYKEDATGMFSSCAEALAFVRSTSDQPHPDLSLTMLRSPLTDWSAVRRGYFFDGFAIRVTHHYPHSRGLVEAGKKHPHIRSGLLTEKHDVQCMDEGCQWVGLFTSPQSALRSVFHRDVNEKHIGPFRSLNVKVVHPRYGLPTQKECAAFLGGYATGSTSLFGTCAMHTVVDSKLRVKGIEGVLVADASIVPTPTVASSATIASAVGYRVSSLIH